MDGIFDKFPESSQTIIKKVQQIFVVPNAYAVMDRLKHMTVRKRSRHAKKPRKQQKSHLSPETQNDTGSETQNGTGSETKNDAGSEAQNDIKKLSENNTPDKTIETKTDSP